MPIANPHNGYVPALNEVVRIIGACHPYVLGMLAQVVRVGNDYYESCMLDYIDNPNEVIYSGGELGGLEPVDEFTAKEFLKIIEAAKRT